MKDEAAERRKVFLKSLGEIFAMADEDASGSLTQEEFQSALPTIASLMAAEGLTVGVKDLEAVFETIDFDNSGSIDVDEFLFGMSQLSEDLSAKHVMDLQYAMLRAEKTLNTQVTQLEEHLSAGIMDLYATVTRARERRADRGAKNRPNNSFGR